MNHRLIAVIHRVSVPVLMCLHLVLSACIAGTATDDDDSSPESPELWESQYPGGCADGADNDGDGLFDCDDTDCQGSADCLPAGDDDDSAGDDDDTAGDAGGNLGRDSPVGNDSILR